MGCGQVHGTSGKCFIETVQRLPLFFLTWLGHEKLLYRSLQTPDTFHTEKRELKKLKIFNFFN